MGKVITILAIVVAFVVGTLVTGTAVDAASNSQGQPFQQLQQQIDDLGLTLGSILCADGEVLKWDDASGQWTCANDNVGEVADGSITTVKLADDAVTSEKIVDGTITSADLVSGAVQLNVEKVIGDPVTASTLNLFSSKAECPDGTTLIGGGYQSFGISDSVEGIIVDNRPLNDKEWRVQFQYDRMGSGSYTFAAVAMCASITP